MPDKVEDGRVRASCAARHFGAWMVEPGWFTKAVSAVKAGLWPAVEASVEDTDNTELYIVDSAGLAIIPIEGQMVKGGSSFGGANSVAIRRAVRAAARDKEVSAILLHIDSPGGTVAGTGELAADVASANMQKPVYAYADDEAASAAYWVASQARRIGANPSALIGSIGAFAILDDTSGQYEKDGIKAILVSTGPYKGMDGMEITEEQIAYVRQIVEDQNELFLQAVQRGRGMAISDVRALADGRIHIAEKAKALGLIDEIGSLDEFVSGIRKELGADEAARTSAVAIDHGVGLAIDIRERELRGFTQSP